MQNVVFNFKPGVPREKQDVLLSKIRSWNAVQSAEHLVSDTNDPLVSRMCFAYLDEAADVDEFQRELGKLPEVDESSVPTPRRLI